MCAKMSYVFRIFVTISIALNIRPVDSSQCFNRCLDHFKTDLRNSVVKEYENIENLHGVNLRNFLQQSDKDLLKIYCNDNYGPFLNCLTNCQGSARHVWGTMDYQALSYICKDHLNKYYEAFQCFKKAANEIEETCRNEIKIHKYYFDAVQQFIDDRTTSERHGDHIKGLLLTYCPTIPILANCERLILEISCTEDFAKIYIDLLYMFLRTVKIRLHAAKLNQYFPENCTNICQSHFGNDGCDIPQGKKITSNKSQTCFIDCVHNFETLTDDHAPQFSNMATLHGVHLRQFVRNSDPKQLENYCKNIYTPFLICMTRCPKSIGRDWGIWDYNSVTSICNDHLEHYVSNLNCVKRYEQNNAGLCIRERNYHENKLNQIEQELRQPSGHIGWPISEFCRSLEDWLRCEQPSEIAKCGWNITVAEEKLHFMFLDLVQYRLHLAEYDYLFPENCKTLYTKLNPKISQGTVPYVERTSIQCSLNCTSEYRNVTEHLTELYRFRNIDKHVPELDRFQDIADMEAYNEHKLRHFVRHTYVHELSTYCEMAYIPYITCLMKCPKSYLRNLAMWDYQAMDHICQENLDDFKENLVCLSNLPYNTECNSQMENHIQRYNSLQRSVDHAERYSIDQIQEALNAYCLQLQTLIECERPVISRTCSAKIADIEHDILVLYLATVEGRLFEKNITLNFSSTCTDLYKRLHKMPSHGATFGAHCLYLSFLVFIIKHFSF